MFDLYELEQFVAFAELGTLTKVSEQFHISNPSVTRVMKRVEDGFGVPLFVRAKNRIALNETGIKAAECARIILTECQRAIAEVQTHAKKLRTITVLSCAPAPLWKLLPMLNVHFHGMTIGSNICDTDRVISELASGSCDMGIVPFPLSESPFAMKPFMQEKLSICVKKDHELADRTSVIFAELNGFNFLLRSELGFWDRLCREQMPASRFLVQDNEFEFFELVRSSSLPCFVTDISLKETPIPEGRISIPISDEKATVTFYLVSRMQDCSFCDAINRC